MARRSCCGRSWRRSWKADSGKSSRSSHPRPSSGSCHCSASHGTSGGLSRSGSRRGGRPPELTAWQDRALGVVVESDIAPEVAFGGGAALAAIHLHHRTSEDLDFFLTRPLDPLEVEQLGRAIATKTTRVDIEVVGPRTSLVLCRASGPFGRIDFAYYPFDPIGRRTSWRGLAVESLLDMTVNKVQ